MAVVIRSEVPLALKPVPKPAERYPVEIKAGIEIVSLSGGQFVMGGGKGNFSDAPAHWATVGQFRLARGPALLKDFGPFTSQKVEEGKGGHPIVNLTYPRIDEAVRRFNQAHGTEFALPSEAAWEYAARGEVVNLRDVMEREGIKERDFVERLGARVENLFAHCLGSTIYQDPSDEMFQKILHSAAPIFGYWVFGHAEGLKALWFDKGGITDATGEEAEKRVNSYNLIDMIGNVCQFVADQYDADTYSKFSPIDRVVLEGDSRVYRGVSGFNDFPDLARPADRDGFGPDDSDDGLGFRVALS